MTATQLEHAKTSNDVIIHGTCDQRFHQLHDFFARNLSTGEDTGAELGGSNGHGNARSVALVQSVLSCGGEVGGVRLLSRAGCERVLEVQSEGPIGSSASIRGGAWDWRSKTPPSSRSTDRESPADVSPAGADRAALL